MERRRSKRVKVNLRAERISGREEHSVFIEDISEHGLQIVTAHSAANRKFRTGGDVDVRFKLLSGETITLRCRTRWAYSENPEEGRTDSIGLEIIDPPDAYVRFVRGVYRSPESAPLPS